MVNLKLALRTLFKAPFVTSVAILSLALGIGANAAIFSLFNQMLLRPLPVPEPSRLVNLVGAGPEAGVAVVQPGGRAATRCSATRCSATSRRRRRSSPSIAAHRLFGANLAYRGQTMNGEGVLVSGSYFPVLGIQPAVGRLLSPQDDQKVGESHVVVLEPQLLDDAVRPQPGGRRRNADRQRPAPDDRRRRPGRVRGHDARRRGRRSSCRSRCAASWSPGFNQFDNRRSYWAYVFARLQARRLDRCRRARRSTCRIARSSTTSRRRCSAA